MSRPTAFTPLFFSLIVITLSATIAIVSSLDYSKPYIVLTEKPDENPQTHYIKILTSLFGRYYTSILENLPFVNSSYIMFHLANYTCVWWMVFQVRLKQRRRYFMSINMLLKDL
ncbi:unnamed protein product [Cuscuta europaea]|uniref:Uncharacterized protein n=1 Tax=Cuscuta europaea TaxID=41803 RepID=A0A9P0Z5V0_CUSEU|nr:unnamed protein product [Cuscuta europaea]